MRRYYINGRKHRLDGPAIIQYFKDGTPSIEVWYRNSKKHCCVGPALKRYNSVAKHHDIISLTAEYYINGVKYNKKEYEKRIIKEKIDLL